MEFKLADKGTLIYVGDPMCSWCWGIALHLDKLKEYYKNQLDFEVILGGLRPGGGDKWDENMKTMLRSHWEHVIDYSGQPFSFKLLDREEFNYDTEPACRAIRVVRDLSPVKEFPFFKAVQYKFYAKSEDPTELSFYQTICEELDISFKEFTDNFNSSAYSKRVVQDFLLAREYGITSFPTVILKIDDRVELITYGYSTFEQMRIKVEEVLKIPLSLYN